MYFSRIAREKILVIYKARKFWNPIAYTPLWVYKWVPIRWTSGSFPLVNNLRFSFAHKFRFLSPNTTHFHPQTALHIFISTTFHIYLRLQPLCTHLWPYLPSSNRVLCIYYASGRCTHGPLYLPLNHNYSVNIMSSSHTTIHRSNMNSSGYIVKCTEPRQWSRSGDPITA